MLVSCSHLVYSFSWGDVNIETQDIPCNLSCCSMSVCETLILWNYTELKRVLCGRKVRVFLIGIYKCGTFHGKGAGSPLTIILFPDLWWCFDVVWLMLTEVFFGSPSPFMNIHMNIHQRKFNRLWQWQQIQICTMIMYTENTLKEELWLS